MLRYQPSRYLAATALLVLAAIPIFAAVTARISGTVKDPSGSVVGGVSVTAIDTDTGIKQGVRADGQGFYSFPSLPVGHYDIEVQASGFEDYRQKGLVLDVNTVLAAQVEQILALHVQFPRQGVQTDFLFRLLQAELPVASRPTLSGGYTQSVALPLFVYSNRTAQQEKGT